MPAAAGAAVVGWATAAGASATVAAVAGAVVTGAIYGAVIGAAVSLFKGENILEGALKGALIGGISAGVLKGVSLAVGINSSGAGMTAAAESGANSGGLIEGGQAGMEAATAVEATPVLESGASSVPAAAEEALVPLGHGYPVFPAGDGAAPSADVTAAEIMKQSRLESAAMMKQSTINQGISGIVQGAGQGLGNYMAAKKTAEGAERVAELERERIQANMPADFSPKGFSFKLPSHWANPWNTYVAYGRPGVLQSGGAA